MIKLALGTAQFGLDYGISNTLGKIPLIKAKEIINFASSSGIESLDTAISYGDSEQSLGNIGIGKFKVITKLPSCEVKKEEIFNWVLSEVNDSLVRLNQKKIYGLLVHDPKDLISDSGQEIFKAMSYLKKNNKVSKIGISAYAPAQIKEAINKYDIDLVQAPLNIFDRRLVESGCLRYLKNKKIEVHTRSCFLQGLLLTDVRKIPTQFKNWQVLFNDWHHWLKVSNRTALETCLSYPLSIEGVDRVVVGIDNLDQLKEIISRKKHITDIKIPNIYSNDENLIDPTNWSKK